MLYFHPELAPMLWTLAGVIGLGARVRLYQKYQEDLNIQPTQLNGFRRSMSRRALESTRIHIAIKVGVILIGLMAQFLTQPATASQPTIFGSVVTVFLVCFPLALSFDAIREYNHQQWMIGYGLSVTLREHAVLKREEAQFVKDEEGERQR